MGLLRPTDPLDEPMTARVQHILHLKLVERFRNMELNLAKLADAVTRIGAATEAALARIAASHQDALTGTQADIDVLTDKALADAERISQIGVTPAPADAPAPLVPVVVPFAPGIEGDPALILRSALPGGSQHA